MGWLQYYYLLKKYDGNLKKATKAELRECVSGNPNTPDAALALAEREYKEKQASKCTDYDIEHWEDK